MTSSSSASFSMPEPVRSGTSRAPRTVGYIRGRRVSQSPVWKCSRRFVSPLFPLVRAGLFSPLMYSDKNVGFVFGQQKQQISGRQRWPQEFDGGEARPRPTIPSRQGDGWFGGSSTAVDQVGTRPGREPRVLRRFGPPRKHAW